MIALVDCNNFFASCERVFNPSLQNKPVVILSNNDGCIIARSNEAKALGIAMGTVVSGKGTPRTGKCRSVQQQLQSLRGYEP